MGIAASLLLEVLNDGKGWESTKPTRKDEDIPRRIWGKALIMGVRIRIKEGLW
jgi:hypothetical protein